MYESIHVRITKEQYEWLRQYCFENRVVQAEVVREALDIFKNQKGERSNYECTLKRRILTE
jgi:hypothetical protein